MVARQQVARGHQVGFVALQGSALEQECEKAQLPYFLVDLKLKGDIVRGARQYLAILERFPELEVIHLHSSADIPRVGLALFLLKLRVQKKGGAFRRPKVIQQNHIWMSHSKRDPLHWLTYSQLDEVWASSEPAKNDLQRYLPIDRKRIEIVKYGRDLNAIRNSFLSREKARRELGISESATVIGAIARIDKAKGIEELIGGVTQAMAKEPSLELVIIGGPTLSDPKSITFADMIDQMVAGLPEEIRKRLHMKGSLPDAARFLYAFDLYAQVSYKETFSLALLDAQLAARPVIGTRSGGTPEVVRENLTGWLCEPEDTESLRATVERALKDRQNWIKYGENARQRVEHEFDFNVVLDSIIHRYQLKSKEQGSHGIHRN